MNHHESCIFWRFSFRRTIKLTGAFAFLSILMSLIPKLYEKKHFVSNPYESKFFSDIIKRDYFITHFIYWFISSIFFSNRNNSSGTVAAVFFESLRNRRYFLERILNATSRRVEPLADFYDPLYIEATFTARVFCCLRDIMLSRQESIYAHEASRAFVLRIHSCSRSYFLSLRFFMRRI